MFTLAQLRRRAAGGAIVTVAVAVFVPAAAFARAAHHDSNYLDNSARHPGTPDRTEMIIVGPGKR